MPISLRISEHLLDIDTLTRIPSHVAFVWRCFRIISNIRIVARKFVIRFCKNLTLTLQNKKKKKNKVTINDKIFISYIIKGLLHWYRWILSLVAIHVSTDARKLASFELGTIFTDTSAITLSYEMHLVYPLSNKVNCSLRLSLHINHFA